MSSNLTTSAKKWIRVKISNYILNENKEMIDSTKIDINQLPKKFCDGAIGAYGKEVFSFALTSGNNLDSFATTPQVMKAISIWMDKQVKEYENKFGEIDMTPPQIQSPIQMADLGK